MKRASRGILVTLLLSSILMVAFSIQAAVSSEPPETEWVRTYGGVGHDQAYYLIQTSDGGYAIIGETNSFGVGNGDFWLIKTDSDGIHQWNRTYGGTAREIGRSVVQTSDGGYVLAGYTESFGAGNGDIWLIRTDEEGNMQWNRTYGGAEEDQALSLIQTSDGGYAIAGYAESFWVGGWDFWLIKTDSDGIHQWNRTYGGTDDDFAWSIIQTDDGGYAIAGAKDYSSSTGSSDFWLVKTNSTGHEQWNQTYGGTGPDLAYDVVQASDGGYAMIGETKSFGAGGWDFWLVRTNSTGDMQWNKPYGGTDTDTPYSVIQTSDGGYAIAGQTESFGAGYFDLWLVKTDASGNAQWNQTYGGTDWDDARSLVQTDDGGYAMAGRTGSSGAGGHDFWLIKLAGVIPAIIDIDPDTLNLKSNGQWITAYIELPEEYSPAEIDVASILLNGSISVDPEAPMAIGDYDMDGIPDLMVKFERAAVIALIGTHDYGEDTGKSVDVVLMITGETAGTPFEGVDLIRVLLKG